MSLTDLIDTQRYQTFGFLSIGALFLSQFPGMVWEEVGIARLGLKPLAATYAPKTVVSAGDKNVRVWPILRCGERPEGPQSTSYCTMRECRPSMILRLHTRNLTDQIICLWSRRLVPITKSRNSSRNFKAVDEYRNEAPVCWNCCGWQNHRA